MTVRYGWHWDTASISFDRAIASMKASQGDVHLVLIANGGFFLQAGDIETIRKVLNALPAQVKIVVRLWHPYEGDWQRYPKAAEYETNWRWVKTQLGALIHRVIFDYKSNEPNLGGADGEAAKRFVADCITYVEAASRAGIVLAVGAWSVGTPHESLLGTVYLPLWKAIAQHGQALSIHLYSTPIPELGETVGLNTVLSPLEARKAIVDTQWPISMQGWFIGRVYRIIKLFADNGLGVPSIYVTEALIDNVFNSDSSHLKEAWRAKWGINEYNRDPRGAATWERWLSEVFKADGFDFERSLAYIFRHARKNIFYHPAFKGVMIFALNAQWGLAYENHPKGTNFGAGSNYDYPSFTSFRNVYLGQINSEIYEDIPMPDYENREIRAVTTAHNIRKEKSTTSPIIGKITSEWTPVQLEIGGTPSSNGYDWKAIKIGALSGYVGMTANLEVKELPAPPDAIYAVTIDGYEIRGTLAEMAKYKKMWQGIMQTVIAQFENPTRIE